MGTPTGKCVLCAPFCWVNSALATYRIKTGFVPNMRVPCVFYVNDHLQALMFEELEQYVSRGDVGGFLPAVKQLANVAALPGIVKASIALPDVHSGYGFAIGNVAAFDMDDPESIVSPGAPPPQAFLALCEQLSHAAAMPLLPRMSRACGGARSEL